jgi:hypothetical protein
MKHLNKTIEYFNNQTKFLRPWSTGNNFEFSMYSILNKINPSTDNVIDIGCGANNFYGKITHLTAIDIVEIPEIAVRPYIVSSLQDFETDQKFDVALCLGSIQFGDQESIDADIKKLDSLLKSNAKVFWRFVTKEQGITQGIDTPFRYYWTFDSLRQAAEQYGFNQINEHIDTRPDGLFTRNYCEWVREGLPVDE